MIYTLPFIAAIIGWLTNYIAVKMLFRPKDPVKVGPITFQGIFPKQHKAFAEKIGNLVADKLFSLEDIKDNINIADLNRKVFDVVNDHLDEYLRSKLELHFPMLSMFLSDGLINQLKELLLNEIEVILPKIVDSFLENMEKDIDVKDTISQKVLSFSSEKIEGILFEIMAKEFKFIEIVGGVLGFLIGTIQVAIMLLSGSGQ